MGVGKKAEGDLGQGGMAVIPAWRSAKLELVHADGWARGWANGKLEGVSWPSMHQAAWSLIKPNYTSWRASANVD